VHFDATTDHIFCIRQILEKKWENNEAVNQLLKDLKKAYDSVRVGGSYNILTMFCIPMKLVRLIQMSPNETCNSVRRGKNLSDMFPINEWFDTRFSIAISSQLCFRIRIQDDLKVNGTYQLLVYADDLNILGGSVYTIKENAKLC